jgi:hypothetical protein
MSFHLKRYLIEEILLTYLKIRIMKKLLLILFVIFASCEKDKGPEYCWSCRWEHELIFGSSPYYISSVRDTCGLTESQIRKYENNNRWTRTDEINCMTCWKAGDPPNATDHCGI